MFICIEPHRNRSTETHSSFHKISNVCEHAPDDELFASVVRVRKWLRRHDGNNCCSARLCLGRCFWLYIRTYSTLTSIKKATAGKRIQCGLSALNESHSHSYSVKYRQLVVLHMSDVVAALSVFYIIVQK